MTSLYADIIEGNGKGFAEVVAGGRRKAVGGRRL